LVAEKLWDSPNNVVNEWNLDHFDPTIVDREDTALMYHYLQHRHGRRNEGLAERITSSLAWSRKIYNTVRQDVTVRFQAQRNGSAHDCQAAVFLNRFSRTLPILHATSGISHVFGISKDEIKGQSFYYCVAESCLGEAVFCLETVKSTKKTGYVRFWFRDPREGDLPAPRVPIAKTEKASRADIMDLEQAKGANRFGSRSSLPNPALSLSASTNHLTR
jgi:hypothetical protein